MSIPLDRLYFYIESIAQKVRSDNILIYHFFPHGSKKIEDLVLLRNPTNHYTHRTTPEIFCNDQEPLNFDYYQHVKAGHHPLINEFFDANPAIDVDRYRNLRAFLGNIYDKAILVHSEQNSSEVEKYKQKNFIPVYYWCHAIIALDWFRYAQHVDLKKQVDKTFLIYNRAWSGTREYRLKFADLLIENDLVKDSLTSVSFNCQGHYTQHNYKNRLFVVNNKLEDFFPVNNTTSCFSADINFDDYQNTLVEVVLETLFDDTRVHLTEKTLRPIACGQPFIVASTPGVLEYLKKYGFKTYHTVFDESYDLEYNPLERLRKIISTMKQIQSWDKHTTECKQEEMKQIADYNKSWFFSQDFFNLVTQELHDNLSNGLVELENTNTSELYFKTRKQWMQCMNFRNLTLGEKQVHPGFNTITRQEQLQVVSKARSYYNRCNNK